MFVVVFYDKVAGIPVEIIGTARSIQCSKVLNDIGFCNITVHPETLADASVYQNNNIVRVFEEGNEIWAGLVEKHYYIRESNGNEQLIITCRTFESLLSRRIVDYEKDSNYSYKTGYSSGVIIGYCLQNIGVFADSADRRNRSGKMEGLSVGGPVDAGPIWSGDMSGKNLFTVCKEIVAAAYQAGEPVDFAVFNERNTYNFSIEVFSGLRGKFRGKDDSTGITNASDNVPVIFSKGFKNVVNEEIWSGGDRVNAVTVVGAANVAIGVNADDDIDTRRIEQYEAIVSNSRIETLEDFLSAGRETIFTQTDSRRVRFAPANVEGARYGFDWNIGDVVSYIDSQGLLVNFRVVKDVYNIASNGALNLEINLELFGLSPALLSNRN